MPQSGKRSSSTNVKIELEKEFEGDLVAHIFDRDGRHLGSEAVKAGQLRLPLNEAAVRTSRVFLGPKTEGEFETVQSMTRIGAHELVLAPGLQAPVQKVIRIPEPIIAYWLLCSCVVRGRVVRPVGTSGATQDLPVCGARVHICEVDRWPWIIAKLPDHEILRLRDDLLEVLVRPPRPPRPPIPSEPPEPPFPRPIPGPDPVPVIRSPLRFDDPGAAVGFNPQPEPPVAAARFMAPGSLVGFNPQPEPPAPQALKTAMPSISVSTFQGLRASSVSEIRSALIHNLELLRYHICLWPWWWGWFRCDEVAVVETDALGRFETRIYYPCAGDKPDLYFWVEYNFGGAWQTVYHPPIPCYTWWDYPCGTEVTIRVTDPRVPACGHDPDLPGKQVAVMSIGRTVSVQEIQGAGAGTSEGLTTGGAPFGGKLEPRVWFSRSALIAAGVTHYRWSYRRLTAPNGVTPDVGSWTIMTRKVGRHYAVVDGSGNLAFPFEPLGPDGNNLFRIQPHDPPAPGLDWHQLDEREDLATAHFETVQLPHGLPGSPTECQQAAVTAGKYEIKLELFNAGGALIDWTAKGIDLKIADDPAPFGTGTVDTIDAPPYYRILNGAGHLVGFRMVLRVDNNCCRALIHSISGAGLTVDANCGFIEYTPGATAGISFDAEHPHGFATLWLRTVRGAGTFVPQASASGIAGAPTAASSGGPFTEGPSFHYSKNVAVSTLLSVNPPPSGVCENAAFAQVLRVFARATDGYSRLSHLDRSDVAAFALATPCLCP